jgi:hypothetical protein
MYAVNFQVEKMRKITITSTKSHGLNNHIPEARVS